MARRKSGKKPAPKKKLLKLETTFTCPFCNQPSSIECTFDKKLKIGQASCRICDGSFCTKINFLTEAIDIYIEWLDAPTPKEKKSLSQDAPVFLISMMIELFLDCQM
ncbi:hypothetical protein QQ045_032467 [Rhodiola kirilowii]